MNFRDFSDGRSWRSFVQETQQYSSIEDGAPAADAVVRIGLGKKLGH